MLKQVLDGIMERRAAALVAQVDGWLPQQGPVLDLGSGTGHVAARLAGERGLEMVPVDVSDIHAVGPAPILLADSRLPFEDGTFSAALLFFMLAYPRDPSAVLAEAARVTRGPLIVVQSLYAGRTGYAWLRVREFFWTVVAFHASRAIGYVPADAAFAMRTRRFFTADHLGHQIARAGLRLGAVRERAVLPGGALVVAAWRLERDA